MESIEVKCEFLFQLDTFEQWVNRVPRILPDKIRAGEQWIWIDKDGFVFEIGRDFMEAQSNDDSFPCRVYRVCCVADKQKFTTRPQHETINAHPDRCS